MDPRHSQILHDAIERAHAAARAAGEIEVNGDGWELFQAQLPIEGMPPWRCAKTPDGDFLTDMEAFRSAVAPAESPAVFRTRIRLMLSHQRGRSGQGFGGGQAPAPRPGTL